MIAIEMDIFFSDFFDRKNHSRPVATGGFKGHAFFKLCTLGELRALDDHFEVGVHFAVAVLGANSHVLFVADFEANQSVLKARDDLACAMEVAKRLIMRGLIEDLAVGVFEEVREVDYFSVCDRVCVCHEYRLSRG